MAWSIPDGQLDRTHTYQNENDREMYRRAFETGTIADKNMAIALMCADPSTPESVIRAQLTRTTIPPRVGYDRNEPGIYDVLTDEVPVTHSIMDFSADQAARESTFRPSQETWA